MAPKPVLKPVNLIAGATNPPPTPSLAPPVIGGTKVPPPTVPKTFVPVTSSYSSGASSTFGKPVSSGKLKSSSGDGFQITDIFGPKRILTEAKATFDLIRNAGPGLATLAGGLGADLYHVVLNDFTGKGYSYKTTEEFAKGLTTTFTPGHYVDYWHNLQNGNPITPLLVQDAGNISIVGSVLGKGLTAGAVASQASAEAAVARAAAGGMTAEAIAKAAAQAAKLQGRTVKLYNVAEVVKSVSRDLNKPGEWSFKPYIWAGKGVQTSIRSGAIPVWYDIKNKSVVNWETKAWGESAANKYADQIAQYKIDNPNATMADADLATLVQRFNYHSSLGRSSLKSAVIRRASRDSIFDGSQTVRALMRERKSPAHFGEINPETGETWGELSPVEEQAIVASINGRAQLIRAMSQKSGISPENLAILGRLDWAPELHLSPEAARLAIDFLDGNARISDMQYSRLNSAVENIAKSIVNMTNKSLAGYGRKTKMPLDYTVPTPHVVQLREAIVKSGNAEALDIFDLAEKSEIFDLPLTDPLRRNLIMRLVELLPDELALDPSLYPAIERENLAFFNRVRKAIDNGEIGRILGEPLPEGPFGPDEYTIPRNRGKGSKAESMLSAARQKVTKLENNILKIVELMDKTEAAHSAKVDLVRRNDLVDAYVAGKSPKSLARKYTMPLSEVEKLLAKHPVARAWREVLKTQEAMASMERVIGKKRAGMTEGEAALEVQKMQGELELLRQEAQAAQNKYETSVQINETVRQLDETALEQIAERFTTLEDDLYSAELDLETAGGNVEDIQVPLDEIPDQTPMTIGRAAAHINELVRRIDERFSKEAEAISPELAADVQRVKIIYSETWSRAENAFYDSPTEQLTAIAQARIEQLGYFYESIIKGATDATSLVDKALRTKGALDIVNGVTSPFARSYNGVAEQRPLFVEGEELPFTTIPKTYGTGTQAHLYDAERIVTLDINSDLGLELIRIADSVEVPELEKYKLGPGNINKTGSSRPNIIVDYSKAGTNASFEITFTDAGEPWWITFEYVTDSVNIRLRVRHDYPTWMDKPERSVDVKQIIDLIDQHISEWEIYKADPINEPDPVYPGQVSRHLYDYYGEMVGPTMSKLEFEYPELATGTQITEKKIAAWTEEAAAYDIEIQNLRKFLDEIVGPRGNPASPALLLSNEKVGLNKRSDFAVIPCGAAKLGTSAPAAEFYTGSMFKDALETARQHFSDDKIFVLSAKHGLVRLDTVLDPYDLKLGDPGSIQWNDISVQLQEYGITGQVLSLLPKDYFKLLERSTQGVANMPSRHNIQFENLFEGTKGIGEQKGRLKQLRSEAAGSGEIIISREEILATKEAKRNWKAETAGSYIAEFDEGVAGIGKTVNDETIVSFAQKAGENLGTKTLEVQFFVEEIKASLNEALSQITDFKDDVLDIINNTDGPESVTQLSNIKKQLEKFRKQHEALAKKVETASPYPKTAAGIESTIKRIYEIEISRVERLIKQYDSAPDFVKAVTPETPEPRSPNTDSLRANDAVGAIELSAEFESYAKTASEDAQLLDDLKAERDDAAMIERDIKDAQSPTPEIIEKYRQSQIDFYESEAMALRGIAETNLGAKWDRANNKVSWDITPIKGAPEWEWWYRLDPKTRQTIARDYFSSAKLKNTAATGPRIVRKAVGIESMADDVNMSIEDFADAMMETIDTLRQSKKNVASTKAASVESLTEEYVKLNSEELIHYQDQLSMSSDEYNAVISRAEYLSGQRPDPIVVDQLRPIANIPEDVIVDTTIASVSVRNAAYEADVLEAMAKEATARMKKAERLSDRLKAFEEYVAQSEKHRAQAKKLIAEQAKTAKIRLQQVKREEKLRNLTERKRLITNQSRRMTKVIDQFAASPGLAEFKSLDAGLPLRTALESGYPSEGFSVEYPLEDGGYGVSRLSGPMYLPTGGFEPVVGGLQKEVVKEGFTGHNKSTNEHYRQGDRHTIFSIRLIADRLGKDMANMTMNERFRLVVSQWGKKVSDVLSEELLAELRARAERKAISDPYDITGQAAMKGLFDEDGLAAYNAGLENPQKMYELAVAIEYGKLIHFEMETRGLDAIDPYAPLEQRIGISRINEDAMYVEKGLKENIAKQSQIFDPSKYNAAWRAMNSVTSKFKTTTLVLSASWQLGDIISTFIISGMVGVNPLDLIDRMKQVRLEEYGPGLRTLLDPTAKMPEVQGETIIAVESPTQDVDLSQQERRERQGKSAKTEKPTKLSRLTGGKYDYPAALKGRNPVAVSFKLNETINRISRHAFFLEQLEKVLAENGTSIDRVFADQSWRYNDQIKKLVYDAADSANKWLGDFADLSMAERKYITPLFPFYAWTKHIHKVFLALGTEHPQSLAWYIYMGTLNYDPNEDPMNLRAGSFNIGGGLASAGVINPLGDVAQGPATFLLYPGERSRLFSSLGPVPRLGLGLGLGFDIANFKDLERPASSYDTNLLGSNVSSLLGKPSQMLGFAANQFPIVKRSLQVLPQGTIPLTDIATGAVSTYPTGEARLNPYTGETIKKWGGQAAAVGRLFSIPGIPYQTDKQIKEVEAAARKRLQQVQLRQMMDK